MRELRDIFDNKSQMLNITATIQQLDAVFQVSCDEFFSYVSPIYSTISTDDLTLLIGSTIENNELGLGIGKFKLLNAVQTLSQWLLVVKPADIDNFTLNYGYIGQFQYVCEFFLKTVEKDNLLMLRNAGIEEPESIDIENIDTLRDYLKKEFACESSNLI